MSISGDAPAKGSPQAKGFSQASAVLPEVGQMFSRDEVSLEVYGVAQLPTRFGSFSVVVFRNNLDDKEHLAITCGDWRTEVPFVRLHSECLTGDVFGSERCDCRSQLERGLNTISERGNGILLYMRQEGRGIGLGNKIRAYALQETGLDTYEANRHLGFADDNRDYRIAALMLQALQAKTVRLATNNPSKISGLQDNGIIIEGREPISIAGTPFNQGYLDTKAKSGHLL